MDNGRKKIILVDDNIVNLTTGRNALAEKYDVFTVPSGEKLIMLLSKITPDMILLDIEMPNMNGYEVIKILKNTPESASIPVIFLTARSDADSELEGLSLGAIDYISKPFSPPLLLKRIEVHLLVEMQKRTLEAQKQKLEEQKAALQDFNDNLQEMVEEKTKTVFQLQDAILKVVSEMVECRDDITGGHIERTQFYLGIMVTALKESGLYNDMLTDCDIKLLLQSSQLHDVGKIVISDSILKKPGKLTNEEFEEIKQHTVFGKKIIEKIGASIPKNDFLKYAGIFAETHHEKWNGSGYPIGLCGEDIPLWGRLMAIVDVYDALTSERPYKKAFTHQQAVEIILKDRGTHFDPVLIDIFQQISDRFINEAVI